MKSKKLLVTKGAVWLFVLGVGLASGRLWADAAATPAATMRLRPRQPRPLRLLHCKVS